MALTMSGNPPHAIYLLICEHFSYVKESTMQFACTAHKPWLLATVVVSLMAGARSLRHGRSPPTTSKLTPLFPHLPFDDAFLDFYGGRNVRRVDNGSSVDLVLDGFSGSGFKSKDVFFHGFFSAAVKLPAGFSAGVVVAFYMSSTEVFAKNHDEIDFELLGHEKEKEWVLQTNLYGNDSVGTGREEKFHLWFDPAEDFHEYSILWNYHHIVFMVDNIPVREVNHSEVMKAYPSKPMSLYSTIWDGSNWTTHGAKKHVNYNYSPFVASFQGFELQGCLWNQSLSSLSPSTCYGMNGIKLGLDLMDVQQFAKLSEDQKVGMKWVRDGFMFYSYCEDTQRYLVMPPECSGQR